MNEERHGLHLSTATLVRRVLHPVKPAMRACTIVARNYLAQANVLARSFKRYHPECPFAILVVDGLDAERVRDDGVELLNLTGIGLDSGDAYQMPMIYNVTELSTAVKPWLLRRFLTGETGAVIYFDPDIEIFSPLYHLADLAHKHSIVLTPHVTEPIPRDKLRLSESDILGAGIYNLGFIGIGPGSEGFLDWWAARLKRESVIDPSRMRFTDQRWIDFVPGLFPNYILRDPAYNVAYWNLHSRRLEWDGRKYTVNGKPLRFFHYSGYNPDQSHLLSKHQGEQPRVLLSEHPAVARICREYKKKLVKAGFNESKREPYGFDYLSNGLKIGLHLRKAYREALDQAERGLCPELPNPFVPGAEKEFLEWLNEPLRESPTITRLMLSIQQCRSDLQGSLPEPLGKDAEGFAIWFQKHGRHEFEVPESMVPEYSALSSSPNVRKDQSEMLKPGEPRVRVCGYLRAELGVGEAARLLIAGLEAANIPYNTLTYDVTFSRQDHPFHEQANDQNDSDVNIICVNADQTPGFAQKMGSGFYRGRHNIGVWFWEVEDFPSQFHNAFDYIDEVWVASKFTRQALRKAAPKPISKFHLPILQPVINKNLSRREAGLPDGFTFLFSFDFFSVLKRKNPIGIITAFKRAFKEGEGPTLLIKTINGDKRLFDLERLKYAAFGRPDIVVSDGYLPLQAKNTLMAMCDCYVSLHRSEGFGLTMAEAMALERPVIATNYSGNLEFMTAENSYLCDYKLHEVGGGASPYPPTSNWAEPDLDHAAALMRHVYSDRAEAAARGVRAGADIRNLHSPPIAGAEMADRLAVVRARRLRFGPISPIQAIEQRVEALENAPRTVLRLSEAEKAKLAGLEQSLHVVTELEQTVAEQTQRQSDIRRGLEQRLDAIEKLISKSYHEFSRISLLEHGLQGIAGKLDQISAHMEAPPYMSDPTMLRIATADGKYTIGYKDSAADTAKDSYVAFEQIFRGSEDLIRGRQRVYLELLQQHPPVLDLGCGRGEMLDLLQEAGVPALGVDLEPAMVAHARGKGHNVAQMDAVQFLAGQDDMSLGAVFCAQVVEHLPYEQLLQLLKLCRTKIKQDGVLVVETVNPHSHRALKTFWVDLTHQKPIFPEVLVALCKSSGYKEAFVQFPCGMGDFDRDRLSEGEYAVIARP
jgi:2-polyprenyl-3-methyl-5-hydroxy-6-metoxy-1,4-benzoquinol methylase